MFGGELRAVAADEWAPLMGAGGHPPSMCVLGVPCLFFDAGKSNSPKSQIIIERKMGCASHI